MTAKSSKGKGRAAQDLPVTASIPLGKQLAHTDKKIRDHAVASLAAFLSSGSSSSSHSINLTSTSSSDAISSPSTSKLSASQSSSYILLPPLEMRKLWKGLFYCFWMSDKPLVQQRLASDLGGLILRIDPDADADVDRMETRVLGQKGDGRRLLGALEFVDGFWEALVREWSGIDRLRMDKYLMLIRRFQSSTFRLLARHGFSSTGLNACSEILTKSGAVLGWDDSKVLPSLSFHLADVWLEELDKMFASEPESLPVSLPDILHPFILLLACTPNPTTYTRLASAIFTPLLASVSPPPIERPSKKRKIAQVDAAEADQEPAFASLISHASTKVGGAAAEKEALRSAVLARMMDVASGKYSSGSKEDVERIRTGVKDANRRKVYAFVREWGGVDDDDEEEEE